MGEVTSLQSTLLVFVGMPGAGKSEAVDYLKKKGYPTVRFGAITDEGLKQQGFSQTPENEKTFRENLRSEFGMAAYAMKSLSAIESLASKYPVVVIDGLYSWEEYLFLKEKFPKLFLVHIFAPPEVRYKRLDKRKVRRMDRGDAEERDRLEISKLQKGGPIASADYLIDNSAGSLEQLHRKIDEVLVSLEK